MDELIKITYNNDNPTVSGIVSALRVYDNFQDFFIAVCKMKVAFNRDGLAALIEAVDAFADRFHSSAIVYLKDCLMCEKLLPFNIGGEREYREKSYQEKIMGQFNLIFPKYSLKGKEVPVRGIGKIDILAKTEEGRSVIIELKIGNKNPTQQLLAYATKFDNPVLVGISEMEIPFEFRVGNIIYYTYSELGVK